MNRRFGLLSLLLLLSLIYYSFYSLMPREGAPANAPATEFSAQRAVVMLKEIAQKPHYHANKEHARVRSFLVDQLKELGFEVQLQEDPLLELREFPIKENDSTRLAAGGYHLITPLNIVGRIKGNGNGKALMLLSHYDSAKVPSPGASDAGSGIVTILEAVRAYQASDIPLQNDLIVLFTDAEELGLDGAKTFVRNHPWARDVGLVLNFEARGSGGPSNMIVETNGGNSTLIDAFAAAATPYPVASSLMYSVYKMLPNDTDSTVFREDGDIDSFFFAFIDDHFDYHTASDTIENLDIETLQHQGSYLLPLLHYFLQADLLLKSESDQVYVNLPNLFLHYPFAWVLPMVIIAAVLLILMLNYGFYLERLEWKSIGSGFAALLLALLLCGLLGYFGWQFVEWLYPNYGEIQHGFKYNGHSYVAFFVLASLSLCLFIYRKLTSGKAVVNLVVAPLFLWIVINAIVAVYLKGAGYFIIPVFFGLIAFWVLLRQKAPNLVFLTLLGAPAIFIFAPLLRAFPVGLGLEMVVISCVFTVLLFGLLFGFIGFYPAKKLMGWVCLLACCFYFFKAHGQSDFDPERRKPNSLVYYLDKDSNQAYWATYDRILDEWTKSYLGPEPGMAGEIMPAATSSKYKRPYTYAAKAAVKDIKDFEVVIHKDNVINDQRSVKFSIIPKRTVDQLYLYGDSKLAYTSLNFNSLSAAKRYGKAVTNEFSDELLYANLKEGDTLDIELITQATTPLAFTVITYAFDLMEHPELGVKARGPYMMPKPFVNTDASIVRRSFTLEQVLNRDSSTQTSEINE